MREVNKYIEITLIDQLHAPLNAPHSLQSLDDGWQRNAQSKANARSGQRIRDVVAAEEVQAYRRLTSRTHQSEPHTVASAGDVARAYCRLSIGAQRVGELLLRPDGFEV